MKVLAYVTNRAIMDRLDEVAGPGNWKNEFREGPGGGVLCGISIRLAGEWITKWDGAENTDIEGVKGGLSGAMKRAAVQWGIGRYLYNLDEGWANIHDGGQFSARSKDGKWFKWDPPMLPDWALPRGYAAHEDNLTLIGEAYETLDEEAVLTVEGQTGPARALIRANGDRLRRDSAFCDDLMTAIRESFG